MSEQAKLVRGYSERDMRLISYWKNEDDGAWYIHFPDGKGDGLLGNLANHQVEEHEDGTVSVTPSILTYVGSPKDGRHGYLTKGVWHEC